MTIYVIVQLAVIVYLLILIFLSRRILKKCSEKTKRIVIMILVLTHLLWGCLNHFLVFEDLFVSIDTQVTYFQIVQSNRRNGTEVILVGTPNKTYRLKTREVIFLKPLPTRVRKEAKVNTFILY